MTMQRYAQLSGNTVIQVIEAETDPDGINGEWLACGNAGPGWTYNGTVFAPPVPVVEPWTHFIDIGPFFDRFGAAKTSVLISTDPGVVAIRADVTVRKWVDLQRADVAQSVAYIALKVPAVTGAVQTAVLNLTVSAEENLALRKVYFGA